MGAEEPTYVRILKEQLPSHWHHDPETTNNPIYSDPVCLLKLALYGHPKSGKRWEDLLNSHLEQKRWSTIDEWKSCFWHDELKCLLVVYLDDFKLAGTTGNMIEARNTIRKGIAVGEPSNVDHFVGVKHGFGHFMLPNKKAPAYGRILNNTDVMKKCVDTYLEVAPNGTELHKGAKTPIKKDTARPQLRP